MPDQFDQAAWPLDSMQSSLIRRSKLKGLVMAASHTLQGDSYKVQIQTEAKTK